MKLYIEDVPHPWITWDKDLYVLQETNRNTPKCNIEFYGLELVPSPWEADIFFINRNAANIQDEVFSGKKVFLFVDRIGPEPQHELGCLDDVKYANDNDWTIVTESLSAFEKLTNICLKNDPWLWRRPSRISMDQILTEIPLHDRELTITTVVDVEYPLSHVSEMIKAYLGAFMNLRDDHNIEPLFKIFSHSELPFEPFNEIKFEGMKPNKIVQREVSKSSLFIYPSQKETYPITAVEAAQLGVPVFLYMPTVDEEEQYLHDPFPDSPWIRWSTHEELSKKIVDHFVGIQNLDFMCDQIDCVKRQVIEEDKEFGLNMFLTELSRRIYEEV